MNDPQNPSMPDDLSVNGDPQGRLGQPFSSLTDHVGNNIDELASRVVDGEIALSDVPPTLQGAVLIRAAQFETHRQTMLRIELTVDGQPIARALSMHLRQRSQRTPRSWGIVAAAASLLILSGLVVTQFGTSNDSPSLMSTESEMALGIAPTDSDAAHNQDQLDSAKAESAMNESDPNTDATSDLANGNDLSAATNNGEIIDIASIEELEQFSTSWSMEELAQESAQEASPNVCLTDSKYRLITRRARFKGVPVEIYLLSSGALAVYRQGDCDLVVRLGS